MVPWAAPSQNCRHGADGAQWVALLANRGAELHHCLVVVARGLGVEHRIGGGGEGFDRLAVVFEGACVVGQPGEDTNDIAVDHGRWENFVRSS